METALSFESGRIGADAGKEADAQCNLICPSCTAGQGAGRP